MKNLLTVALTLGLTIFSNPIQAQSSGYAGSGMLNSEREVNQWYNFFGHDVETKDEFFFSIYKVVPTLVETNFNGKYRFDMKLSCNVETMAFQFNILVFDEFTNRLILPPHKYTIDIVGEPDYPYYIGGQPISGGVVWESNPAKFLLEALNESPKFTVNFRDRNGRVFEADFEIPGFLEDNLAYTYCTKVF